MSKRSPPDLRKHRVLNVSVWELLEREGLLDRVYIQDWLWVTLSPQLRRRRERERQLLQATALLGYTPPRTQRGAIVDPWLYLTTARRQTYRLHPDGAVQIWKRNPPQPGIGGGGWGWYLTARARLRWLWLLSNALSLRELRAMPADGEVESMPARTDDPPVDSMVILPGYTQLSLFD